MKGNSVFIRCCALMLSALFAGSIQAQACGTAHDTIRLTAPTSGLCASGTASAVGGTGPFTWTCTSGAIVRQCATRPHCHDVDGNGVIAATTDGLIIHRVMVGMTGTAVSSAAKAGAPRSTWPAIRDFLAQSCGYTNLVCIPNGQDFAIAPQPSVNACVNAISPEAGRCCAGTIQVITYDNPLGSNSCVATCGPLIGAAPEPKIE